MSKVKTLYSLGSTLGRLYCHRKQPVMATESRNRNRTKAWIHFTSMAASLRKLRLQGACWEWKRSGRERKHLCVSALREAPVLENKTAAGTGFTWSAGSVPAHGRAGIG